MKKFMKFFVKTPFIEFVFIIIWFIYILPFISQFLMQPLIFALSKALVWIIDKTIANILPMAYQMYIITGRDKPIIMRCMDEATVVYCLILTIIVLHLVSHYKNKLLKAGNNEIEN